MRMLMRDLSFFVNLTKIAQLLALTSTLNKFQMDWRNILPLNLILKNHVAAKTKFLSFCFFPAEWPLYVFENGSQI